jgi:transcriptional regulator with XRE-family HTH domain
MAKAAARTGGDRARVINDASGEVRPGDVHAELGRRLRERRQELALSLAELAARANLTKGHLSMIERGLASPSMASLISLCAELQVRIGSLFDPPRSSLVRGAERVRIDYGGQGLEQYLLTPGSRARLQVTHTTFEPGGTAGAEQYSLQAEEEFLLVLSGVIVVEMNGASHVLKRDDAFTFDPREKHTFRNPSADRAARVLFVVTPPLY